MEPTNKYLQQGVTLIEVLVTIVILTIGLLGLAGLQSRLQVTEVEAYQRAQALILLEDMANRITVNRNSASSYVTGVSNPLGTGMTCPTSTATRKDIDLKEWCNTLQGASEVLNTNRVGAFLGGRGCIENLGSGQYLVTIAWQGVGPISAPPSSIACGKDQYDTTSSVCVNDLCRRVLTTIVRVATLT